MKTKYKIILSSFFLAAPFVISVSIGLMLFIIGTAIKSLGYLMMFAKQKAIKEWNILANHFNY